MSTEEKGGGRVNTPELRHVCSGTPCSTQHHAFYGQLCNVPGCAEDFCIGSHESVVTSTELAPGDPAFHLSGSPEYYDAEVAARLLTEQDGGVQVVNSTEPVFEDWQRGDIVRDDTGNLFCYHNLHGWFGLASNQTSARGHYERHELCDPLTLLVRNGQAASS